ncbi:MAG TPA: hypothetical protein PK823_13375 [Novosphingobium sp.]|nr:hypothetical protein [Novosphingobium sp.]
MALTGGCGMHGSSENLIEAVMNMDENRVRQLVESGAPIDQTDRKLQTPLILAAKTDQFRIAEYLIGKGANVLAASKFGWTVGYAAQNSMLQRGPEAEARDRVLEQLRQRGYPFPAAEPAVVKVMLAEKRWPPA